MGSTSWNCRIDYDPDPETALEHLRDVTFATRRYEGPGGRLGPPLAFRWFPGVDLRMHVRLWASQAIGGVATFLLWAARGGRRPRSIAELQFWCGLNGTHSILDIDHISDVPEFAAATPLSRRRLLDWFGTTTPTRRQVDEAFESSDLEFDDAVRRGEAAFITIHDDDGRPVEYEFLGNTGD